MNLQENINKIKKVMGINEDVNLDERELSKTDQEWKSEFKKKYPN